MLVIWMMIRMLFVLSLSTSSSATSSCTRVSLPISRTRIYLSHLHTNHHCEHTHAHARTLVHTRAPRTHARTHIILSPSQFFLLKFGFHVNYFELLKYPTVSVGTQRCKWAPTTIVVIKIVSRPCREK